MGGRRRREGMPGIGGAEESPRKKYYVIRFRREKNKSKLSIRMIPSQRTKKKKKAGDSYINIPL